MNKLNKLLAGTAKCDITNKSEGRAILDPLYAKALVVDDGNTRLVIITMDTTAIGGRHISDGLLPDVGEDFMPELRAKVEKELQIPSGNILVNASHNHPPGRLLCDDNELIELTSGIVKKAFESMVEVKAGSSVGYEAGITINRTLRLKNGNHWSIRHSNPCPPDEEVEDVGVIDPEIGIIRFDRMDGTPLAVIYNFACHPLFGDLHGSITANFPGVASKIIEENLGNGTMALFLQGAAGDVVDIFFKDFERPRNVYPLGVSLGQSALKAIRKVQTQDASLKVSNATVQFPFRIDIPNRIQALEKEQSILLESLHGTTLNFKSFLSLYLKNLISNEYPANYSAIYKHSEKIDDKTISDMDMFNNTNIKKYLESVYSMEKLARIQDDIETLKKHQAVIDAFGENTISAEIMGIKIGECVLFSAPFEALTEIGLRIKKASPYRYTFMAAYSNGYMHYGASADYYNKGGYEVTECLLAPEWQEIYEEKIKEIICKL